MSTLPYLLAAQRWIDLGATSARSPLLQILEENLFRPLGLRCAFMICDPITSTGSSLNLPTFSSPRWSADDVNPEFAISLPAEAVLPFFSVTVSGDGHLEFVQGRAGEVDRALVPLLDAFDNGRSYNTLVDQCRIATTRLVLRAFKETCLPSADPTASRLFADAPDRYAEQLWSSVAHAVAASGN